MQVESLKTKCAKAAEIAIKLTNEKQNLEANQTTSSKIQLSPLPAKQTLPPIPAEPSKSLKDLEKKVTKLRNEN